MLQAVADSEDDPIRKARKICDKSRNELQKSMLVHYVLLHRIDSLHKTIDECQSRRIRRKPNGSVRSSEEAEDSNAA